MLPVPDYQLSRYSPEMTVAEIRELRRGWDKFGSVDGVGWREQLHWIREKEVEELNEEKRQTSERKKGLLFLLTDEDTAVPSPVVVEPLPISSSSDVESTKKSWSFETDHECKEFLSIENALKWRLYYEIPEFNLKFFRFGFRNGAVSGCSSMVEQKPSKLMTGVRFPSPAPIFSPLTNVLTT